MTENTWPDKPGVPLNPEEPRYHWVKGRDGTDTIVFWCGHGGDTHYENGDLKELDHWYGYPMWIAQEWTYIGPCLTPDEAAALQARADRNAAGFARVDAEAERAKFLHKQEIAALQKRVALLVSIIMRSFCYDDEEDLLRLLARSLCRIEGQDPDAIVSVDKGPFEKNWKRFLPQARAALGGKDE